MERDDWLDIEGFPRQKYGIDCGIFMLMYALYKVMDAPFDFTVVSSLAYSKLYKKLFYIKADIYFFYFIRLICRH
ncbi:unnamed protein product [Arctogadus glacialis]